MTLHWRIKLVGKLILARLPVRYEAWRRLSVFRLGEMDDPDYVIDVFLRHFERSGIRGRSDFTVLELGPGDSVGSALVAAAFGATQTYLIDVGPFATRDVSIYRALAAALVARNLPAPDLSRAESISDVLLACRATYLTNGVESLRSIPDQSVDFVWSHAVLEHVPRGAFVETLRELSRLLRADGVMSHRVDFEDHFENSLNSLRFPERRWESPLFRHSGFYTNRLRLSEVLTSLEVAGLVPRVVRSEQWDVLPLATDELDAHFRDMAPVDLLTRGADIVAYRPP